MSIDKSKNKNEIKKINDDMGLTWLNWSVAIINATLQLLDIYRIVFSRIVHFKSMALKILNNFPNNTNLQESKGVCNATPFKKLNDIMSNPINKTY